MKRLIFFLATLPALAMAQGWGSVSAPKEEVFSWSKWWTEPMFGGTWMAWTRASLGFFVFIFGFIALMALLEWRKPGGNERQGMLGLVTTRGDRLFIGLLGSAYIFLAWIGLIGTPVWVPAILAAAWIGVSFWRM